MVVSHNLYLGKYTPFYELYINTRVVRLCSEVGEHLAKKLAGKIKLEDGGYDWKIMGPDVPKKQN